MRMMESQRLGHLYCRMVIKHNSCIYEEEEIEMKIRKKLGMIIALATILVLTMGTVAFASASSSWQYKTVYSHSYKYRSTICTRSLSTGNTIEAVAEVMTSDGSNAPTGYMGAQARLYTSTGDLKYASSTVYNSSNVINIYAYSKSTSASGYFYAQTKASFYNGNGYTAYTANRSPNAAVTTDLDFAEYDVNECGETYGSGLDSAEIGEDLI